MENTSLVRETATPESGMMHSCVAKVFILKHDIILSFELIIQRVEWRVCLLVYSPRSSDSFSRFRLYMKPELKQVIFSSDSFALCAILHPKPHLYFLHFFKLYHILAAD